ncbi:Acetylornithine deacetylase/Succinyl-diaminopimelate desuccinylase [Bowdeniella nasicola]|uniref:Acetylornithine deacetylase/Succinyl-diaminopimelate desuccinylase n=1 Tax=Bowdeniella nasicola TaxID=208480 RepID=A0A1H4AYI7_9ACTO|nr:M20/M25/M40 family metallo-hydrolase [Bowdeniella nasicola]SEA40971.1 Acetylornithine deacetylase/Succinyl-diaminopimelate desuccinylase [Bowdeniella nasicola]
MADTNVNIPRPEDEVVEICRKLIQIDTSNFGTNEGIVERPAAEYVAELLEEVGLETRILESSKGRTSVFARLEGEDPSRPALVLHGHTDVVPAAAEDWQVHPFSGEVRDGLIWGRGAVDMKNMVAMMIAVVRYLRRKNIKPARDVILAFFADEEAGSKWGGHWIVDHHPEIFDGATEAIGEVGGYSTMVAGKRVYLLQTAEKGLQWLNLVASGRAGHGSQINEDNAITHLAGAIHRIGNHAWPLHLTDTVRQLLDGVADLTGTTWDEEDESTIWPLIDALGPAKTFVGATLRTGANPTQLGAGYKANVIPTTATATIDVRPIPGTEEDMMATLKRLAGPDVEIVPETQDIGLEVPFKGDLVDTMVDMISRHDPEATVLPYMLSAGTDNKSLSLLGIKGYGFTPLQLPVDVDFPAMFHGVDERVPISALEFGCRVLLDLLQEA